MTEAPTSIDDILARLASAPAVSKAAIDKTSAREATLTKPPGALGRLEEITRWLAGWQDRSPPRIDNAAVVVFAGNHGVATRGVSAYPPEVTAQMVANFEAGGAAVNQLSRTAGAGFKVIPIDLERPTGDFTEGPAMSEADFIAAFATGWRALEDGVDLLCVGEMGIANTTSAAALCHALFAGKAADWTGPGTGVSGQALSNKTDVVATAVSLHGSAASGPLDLLRRLGGRELAAMAGAILAARYRKCPVLIDGYVAGAAAAALAVAHPGSLDHVMAAHVSAEPGHRRLLDALGKSPLLDLGMRLGEASGAALAIPIVRAACACHAGMASFADAGISEKPA
ncbi:MAG: nicotinate-nucleotide--dimethylbenzimidazole phosphoribosyltransferase [Rhodospirillales bacterium]